MSNFFRDYPSKYSDVTIADLAELKTGGGSSGGLKSESITGTYSYFNNVAQVAAQSHNYNNCVRIKFSYSFSITIDPEHSLDFSDNVVILPGQECFYCSASSQNIDDPSTYSICIGYYILTDYGEEGFIGLSNGTSSSFSPINLSGESLASFEPANVTFSNIELYYV